LAYVSVVRYESRFVLRGWAATYRLHVGYAHLVTTSDIVAGCTWAAQLDAGSAYFGDGIKQFRSVQSQLVQVVGTEISRSDGLKYFLNIGSAMGHGEDSFPPALSAGQALQVEWITGERGKGVNGRTFFPYLGSAVHNSIWVDAIEEVAAQAVELICNLWAAFTPTAIAGDPVVAARIRNGSPVSVLDSKRITAVAVRRDKFVHQRRRVEWRRPFDLTP